MLILEKHWNIKKIKGQYFINFKASIITASWCVSIKFVLLESSIIFIALKAILVLKFEFKLVFKTWRNETHFLYIDDSYL